MSGPSWLVDSKRIATKIKNASAVVDPSRVKWKSNPTKACPRCNHTIDNSDVVQEWPGLPGGVKFDPSDQELILHLLAKVGIGDAKPHPFISEFIPTVEEEDGICYTHPEKLPGCKRTGSLSHFFHRTFKAYNTGRRKRRKINTEDLGDVRWHKTGKTKPVIVDGKHLGCKKIMVLYMSATKGGKPEKTNWVMHQYHLGTGEDEKDGEYVVSKIFYQQQSKPGDKNGQDLNMKMDNNFTELDPALGMKSFSPHKANKHDQVHEQIDSPQDRKDDECLASEIFYEQQSKPGDRIGPDLTVELDNAVTELDPAPDIKQDDVAIHEQSLGQGDKLDDQVDHPTEDAKWWEGESQYLLDSQQLAENIAICEEFLQSQSSCADGEAKKSCLLLSEYAHMSKEVLKRDLEECQKLDIAENANTEQDTPPDFRLSQLEFGSQESFSWACSKHID